MRTAIYARRSALDERLGRSVSEQEDVGRADCDREAWTVVGVYVDDGRSASRFATKRRDDWQRLLVDMGSNSFDLLWLWESDRGSRELEDWASLLNACRRQGIKIHVSTHRRTYDPRIGRDWRQLAEDGVDAAYSSEKQSLNLKRAFAAKAQRGEAHGFVAYGWRRQVEYDDRGRRVSSQDVLQPEQAAVIRESVQRIVAGESIRSICRDLNQRNVPGVRGGTWNSTTLRQVVQRPRNAGYQVHQNEIIGKGSWDEIVSEDDYARLMAIIKDPDRRTNTGPAVRTLLSGLALCGRCGTPMRTLVAHGKMKRRYGCPACFKVTRNQAGVDAIVVELVTRRLAMPDAIAALVEEPDDIRPLLDALAATRARLDVAADSFADGTISASQLARISGKLRPQVDELERRVKSAVPKPELADLATSDIAERWESIPLERRRLVIQALMTVRINPAAKKGRPHVDPNDLEIEWQSPA